MIHAFMRGGMGNQMFIYSCAKSLSIECQRELILDTSSGFIKDPFKRSFQLGVFNRKNQEKNSNFIYFFCILAAKIFRKKSPDLLERLGIFTERENPFQHDSRLLKRMKASKKARLYLLGYWQNENYFKSIFTKIKEEFLFITPEKSQILERIEKILSGNVVCLHLRRSHNLTHTGASKPLPTGVLGSLPVEYYKKCISIIRNKIPNPIFFCFSDCPYDSQAILGKEKDLFYFHDYKQKEEPDFFEMFIMTQCKHFIIANSTFSWWGAWLANSQNKIVLCPNHQKYLSCAFPSQNWIEVHV